MNAPSPIHPSRRRALLGALAGGAAATFGIPMLNLGRHAIAAAPDARYSTRAIDLVTEALVIDMLAPLKIDFRPEYPAGPLSAADAADLRASGITGFHHAIGIGGPDAYAQTLAYLAAWQGFVGRGSHAMTLVGEVEDLDRAKADGKAAVIMGVQNAEHFRTADDVAQFYKLGLRCAQLTYNAQNLLGAGSTERVDGGVSDFGAAIIAAMNDVGMLIDVSHCGERTTLDAIALSPRPIAITHANCRGLFDHPRLKSDEAIRRLAAKGGVMGITGVRMFVRDREPTTIEHMVDHIDHVARLTAIEHVGIGSDADLRGYDALPADQNAMLRGAYKASYGFRDRIDTDGFDHPRKVYDLTEAMIRRRYTDAHIKQVLGGNFRRLLAATWKPVRLPAAS
ncbi:membrane dipeptidase [Luteimonas sp. FCS-9]|uniref:dipeptidase n=1 Tax=Luteimonas sp. FCS-9 TaxID=1547516 RepID=UPI00063E7D99|nr:membrane dipeptidase [Luteimonas sp. FCS-9]KLI98581.1 dipeptidase [Luteimonas sp. FCS-9]